MVCKCNLATPEGSSPMGNHKFAAADVHAATTTFAVLDDSGKFVMETVVGTSLTMPQDPWFASRNRI